MEKLIAIDSLGRVFYQTKNEIDSNPNVVKVMPVIEGIKSNLITQDKIDLIDNYVWH